MSAKKNNAALTERQAAEQKEARKLKIYSIAFIVAICLMVCVVIFTWFSNSGIMQRSSTALKVNDHKVSSVEMNYFFVETVNNWYSNYSGYASLFGLDTSVALDEQEYSEGTTWADYFIDQAKENARSTYALYDAAKAEGFTLSEDEQVVLNSSIESVKMQASYYGYADGDSFVQAMYGKGANLKSLRAHNEISALANAYYAAHQANLTYTDADLRAVDADNFGAYSSFNYSYYTVNGSSFYEGGTEGEDGTVTYSDAEMAAGLNKAEATAKELMAASSSLDAMNEAIEALELESTAATTQTNVLYTNVPAALQEWIADSARSIGDTTVIDRTTTDADGNETTVGYFVVLFQGANTNEFPLVNVRHILVPVEGGTQDENGNTTYSDEEYAAAEASAQEILAQWDGTEDGFAALAKEHSTDTGSASNGGLYENVFPGQMVSTFNDWCFDASRQTGDSDIVRTEYGYHIMYFVGQSDVTYRDYMIRNKLTETDMTNWYNALVETATVETIDTSKVSTGLILTPNTSN